MSQLIDVLQWVLLGSTTPVHFAVYLYSKHVIIAAATHTGLVKRL